jgi:outer membrane lipoprotein-sorting protein|tara:strand:+ start:22 stop:636 length:615 start_codon:yes stop_codon:yes gene_type:complete
MYFRRKFLGTILSIFLIFIFSTEVTLPKNKSLKLIEDYLGDIKTLQAEFSQTNQTGDILTGIFFLKKPGKIRFSYDPPQNLQIVSKQQAVLIFDPKNGGSGPLTYPLHSTPLGFLIKSDLSIFINENGESLEIGDLIIFKVRNPQYNLSVEFNKNPVSLIGWEFENQMGEIIKIRLNNIQKNNYISDEIFKTDKDFEIFRKQQG